MLDLRASICKFGVIGKPTKVKRRDKKLKNLYVEGYKTQKVEPEPNQEEVYQISSGNEDNSKGMKSMKYLWFFNNLSILQSNSVPLSEFCKKLT